MLVYLLRSHRLGKTTVHLSPPKSTSYPRVRELCEYSEHDDSPASQNLICHHMLIRTLLKPLGTVLIPESAECVHSRYNFLVPDASSPFGLFYSVRISRRVFGPPLNHMTVSIQVQILILTIFWIDLVDIQMG